MKKAVVFVFLGFCAFVMFDRFFLGTDIGEGYDYMNSLVNVFDIFEWIGDSIKSVFDGIRGVGDWWNSLFGVGTPST